MKKLILLCSTAVVLPTAAFAQSTGSVDFEKETIVVTGTRTQAVGGVQSPDTSKAKAVLTQEMISRQNAGQTILDTINLVPGVSFQNNDAYGSSGGTLTIRGFDSSRVSLTFDGIQLNDSGNYAIFSNQQMDPELIEQVNVNLGSTDVDSPTASAVGGTVNYRTMVPTREAGIRMVGSVGEYDFLRVFGVVNTGEIGPWGTRAFFAASKADNRVPYNNYGRIDKQQYNARIYQDVGSNGDFVSLAGHYNANRNNFFGSSPLRNDIDRVVSGIVVPRIPGSLSQNRYPANGDERFYNLNYPCHVDRAQPGVADAPAPSRTPNDTPVGAPDPNGDFASCGTEFDRRYNPSNTGNFRGASKFSIGESLVFTFDPSYQFVKANGGGTVTAQEGLRDINPIDPPGTEGATSTPAQCALGNTTFRTCVAGYLGGTPFFGRDINGDGDTIDTVTVVAPSQTRTRRPGLITGLRWEINDQHTVRVSYTWDRARHRQTGEVGLLDSIGEPFDVFPIDDPEADGLGITLQKRDRLSYAILHRFAGEYRGEFFDDKLNVNIGLGLPFFKRELNNYCFTSSASGFVECFGQDAAREAQFATLNPTIQGPQKRTFKYNKLLPNIGFVYDFTNRWSAFGNYSKGLSVPSTDNLYNSFFFAPDTEQAQPDPETTDSFDLGGRYRSSKLQGQLSLWYTRFNNRTASAFDPELNVSVFRNLGQVNKWGIDGSVAYEPMEALTVYAFGSWNQSKIKENIQVGALPVGVTCDSIDPTTPQAFRSCAFTAGNRESGAPKYTYGASVLGNLGPVELGVTAKRTGPRYIYDNSAAVFRGDVDLTSPLPGGAGGPEQVFDSTVPAYWLVNLDARVKLDVLSPRLDRTYFQLNVYNLFDKFYVGGFGGGLSQSVSTAGVYGAPLFVQIGAPRTISGTLNFQF
ncbi:MAG TPA: TonB-dependent receptor [Sphingomicrobium sp.]|nr:TonB-dependent receptor [Sphingomicrobium sp.]